MVGARSGSHKKSGNTEREDGRDGDAGSLSVSSFLLPAPRFHPQNSIVLFTAAATRSRLGR
jgi:hypothetical protein